MAETPTPRAVISLGTNTTRLLVIRDDARKESVEQLERGSVGTRLGEGLSEGGPLGEGAMQRTLDAIATFMDRARTHGAQVSCIATSAMRRASNAGQFIARIERLTGAPLEILGGDEEAMSSFAGATHDGTDLSERTRVAVLDIGGGSTELAIGRRGKLEVALSLEIGAVRLAERFPAIMGSESSDAARAAAEGARDFAASTVKAFERFRPIDEIRAVGGTPLTVGAIAFRSDVESVDGHFLTREQIDDVVNLMLGMDVGARRTLAGMIPQRADILPAGGLILSESLRALQLGAVRLETNDLLLGYLLRSEAKGEASTPSE